MALNSQFRWFFKAVSLIYLNLNIALCYFRRYTKAHKAI